MGSEALYELMDRYSKLNLFGTEGRLGRFVYFLFSFIIPTSFFWIIAALAGQLFEKGVISQQLAYGILVLALIIALVMLVRLTIQRSHDLNKSGWLSLLVILFPPLIAIFWLLPGSKGVNNYNAPAEPLPLSGKLIAVLLFLGLLLPMLYLANKFAVMAWIQQLISQGLSLLPL